MHPVCNYDLNVINELIFKTAPSSSAWRRLIDAAWVQRQRASSIHAAITINLRNRSESVPIDGARDLAHLHRLVVPAQCSSIVQLRPFSTVTVHISRGGFDGFCLPATTLRCAPCVCVCIYRRANKFTALVKV